MYRRYTLDEVKRKIIDALQDNSIGLSGVELASATGINRMTITKYPKYISDDEINQEKEGRFCKCVVCRTGDGRL